MEVDLGLQVAANAFVEALTPIAEEVAPADRARARDRVVAEAHDLACAFIDADRRATDEELWSLIVAFAPLLDPGLLEVTPDALRAEGRTEGRRRSLETPSALFVDIVAYDATHGTDWATTYYEHAVALGFMVASLDDHTSRDELLAIESFRGLLLAAIKGTPAGPAPADPAPPRAPGAPSSTATSTTSTATPAAATDAQGAESLPPARPLEELLGELEDLVGLAAVKDEVKLVTNLLRVEQLRADRGLGVPGERSHHLVFTGNPGTGKTTVARLLAQIYRTLGVVPVGQLVETDRAGLVAGFVGQTAGKVVAVFDRADGGVLLIDEAYALARGGENDFGREAIDTIVKLVEDRRDRIVVIAAGYPDEMDEFIGANPGLTSRFPRTIHFPDYSTDELVAIFRSLCDDNKYLLDADAERAVRLWVASQPRVKGFGNGRLVRNLFEAAVARQATRVVEITRPSDIDLVLLLPADIPAPDDLPEVDEATAPPADPGGAGPARSVT